MAQIILNENSTDPSTPGTGTLALYAKTDGTLYTLNSSGTTTPLGGFSGTLTIAQGGTGQTTAATAFNALSPITAIGDLIIGNGTNSATILPIGGAGTVLSSDGSSITWQPGGGGGGGGLPLTGGTLNTAGGGATTVNGETLALVGGVGDVALYFYSAENPYLHGASFIMAPYGSPHLTTLDMSDAFGGYGAIVNVANPTNPNDVATKSYVDGSGGASLQYDGTTNGGTITATPGTSTTALSIFNSGLVSGDAVTLSLTAPTGGFTIQFASATVTSGTVTVTIDPAGAVLAFSNPVTYTAGTFISFLNLYGTFFSSSSEASPS